MGGQFTTIAGTSRNNLARLTSSGLLDASFNPGAGANSLVYALALQSNGRVVVGGAFTTLAGGSRNFIGRLLSDGTLDSTFAPSSGANGIVRAVAIDGAGNVLIGGDFTTVNGVPRGRVARLTPAGALDLSFDPGAANLNQPVNALMVQLDGKILIGGLFTQYGASPRAYAARLNSDGTLDSTFNPGTGLDNFVSAIGVLPDGRVLMGGGFTAFNGVSRNRIIQLTPTGQLDPTINLGSGANSFVAALQVQSDGKVAVGGGFTQFNGVTANYLTRINGGLNVGSGTIGFSATNYTVSENAGSVTITVVRSAGTSNAVAVAYAMSNGTATNGMHYTASAGTLAFVEGETLKTFNVTVLDDFPAATNAPRTINLQLSPITTGPTNTAPAIFSVTAATITITDSDSALAFAFTDFSVGEATPLATITVLRSGSTNGTVMVDYVTSNGTATAGADYTAVSGTLTFGDGVVSQTFNVPILDDILVEGNETVLLALTNPVGLGNVGALLGTPATATLTIVDDDFSPGQIGFSSPTYSVIESGGSITIPVIRTNGTLNLVSVNYATANGSASAGADYVATAGSLVWGDGDGIPKTFRVTILDDTAVEGNETVILTLSGASGGATISVPTAILTILDDDDSVQFTATALSFFESASNAVLNVQRIGAGNNTVTVTYATVPGGTAVAGTDYTATNGVLTFAPGVTNQSIVVPITNNKITNAAKTFNVQLAAPNGGSLGAGTLAQVTILDDDSVLQFAAGAVSVVESAGSITLNVTRTGASNSVVTVQFTTLDGTATNGMKYVTNSGTLVFGTNQTNATITVQVINNTIVETNQTFSVVLSSPTGEASLGSISTTVVTILDDDSLVQFATGTYSVVERAGTVTLVVVRTGASNGVVSVPFSTANVTAFAGLDYVGTNGTVTFLTNVTSTNIVVTILNDKLVEADETFTVTLGVPVGESSLGPTNSATVTILDDESTLEFALASVSALESAGTLAVQVTRVGALDSAVTVAFSFSNGSATNGVDYFATTPGVLTFGVGVNLQSITVSISNNLVVGPDKTFAISLSSPGGEAVLGTKTVASVTILDDDSVLQFPFPTLNVSENAGNVTVTVQRTGATNVPVGVQLATADGLVNPALSTADYGALTTNLIFAVGENLKSVVIYITNDSIAEGTETFRVLLSNVTGQATLGSNSTLTVSIIDDDFRTIVAAGYFLQAESYQPTNNAVDPLEEVSVWFSLQNIGNINSPDLTATLQLTGGVLSNRVTQVFTNVYTNLTAAGPVRSNMFSFKAAQVQTVIATLNLSDVNGSAGTVTFPIDLGVPTSTNNRTLINIPGTISVPTSGPASPYPTTITVTNVAGLVNKVTVRLNGFTHTWPADVDILLVGPAGQKVLLMSDAGGGNSVTNLTLTFDDAASSNLPELSTILAGTFRPTDYPPADSFPAPAPAGPYATSLSVFNGSSANGTWMLYIVDDTDQNFGTILNGWTLNLSTVSPLIDLAASMTSSPAGVRVPGLVTFTTVITNLGPNVATGVIYSNVLPAGLTLVSATNSAGSNFTVSGSTVVGNLGPLATNATLTVTLTVSTAGSGSVTNTAVVSSSEVELAPADNTASASVVITPAVPFSLFGQTLGNGSFSLTVSNAVVGKTYVVEGTTNFANPVTTTVWTPVATNVANGSTLTASDPAASGFRNRFYRAIER